nr:unnamed protein product [Spirometra erinaceieuropaei]
MHLGNSSLLKSCPSLNDIRLAQEIKDLTIEVKGGDVLHTHRVVLAARVPSLRANLSGFPRNDDYALKWPTVSLRVNLENLPATWDFAKSLNIEPLMDTCVSLMKKRFEDFVTTEHFVRLPAENVLSLLRSNDLSVRSEDKVIGAIARWVDHADDVHDERLNVERGTVAPNDDSVPQSPYGDLSNILEKIRMHLYTVSDCVQDEKQVVVAPRCRVVRDETSRPRQTFFLFGVEKDQRRWSVLRCDPHLQEEERIAEMQKRWWASYSLVNESIFVVGGGKDSRRVDELLVSEGCWPSGRL